ncbi:MAG: transposase [Planctomycetaceae bacterium]|nr:transposase [Planctomycetaceae bacterium]
MDKRRIIDDALYTHFVTFSVSQRRKLLDHDHPKRILLGVLNHQLQSFAAKCVGFVIMPEHVHALIWLPETGQLLRFLHGWKRMSSFTIRQWYREHAPNYCEEFGEGERFWNPKYYAFEVDNEAKLEEKLVYIHLNPVRRDLVGRPEEWQWSSARWYIAGRSVGVPIEWVC